MKLKEKLVLNEDDTIPSVELEPAELAVKPEEKPTIEEIKLGLSRVISDLIKDEWEAIDGYNSGIANFSAEGISSEVIDVLKEIAGEEMVHVGQLEKCLTLLSPDAEKIDDGQKEAEKELDGEDGHKKEESLNNKKDYIKKNAKKDFEVGQTFSSDDFNEFKKICKEDGFDVNKEDFEFYFDCLDEIRASKTVKEDKDEILLDPALRVSKNIITGKTYDEYMEKFGNDYIEGTIWDFSEEDLAENPDILDKDKVYWDIDGRLYETPETVRESVDVRKKVLEEKENIPDYLKYWYDVVSDEVEYLHDEEWDEENDYSMLKDFPEEALDELIYYVAEDIGNNDYLWETINDIIHERISTWIKKNAELAKPSVVLSPESGE